MLYCKRFFFVRKIISISVVILFAFNSVSFAQPMSKDTLRAASTALSVPTDVVRSFKESIKPVSDKAKSSSAGIMIKVDKLELGDINEIIAILTGKNEGLKSTIPWIRAEAALTLSRFGKETIAPYTDEMIIIFTGNEGLKGNHPWIKKEIVGALSRLDKDKTAPCIDEIIAILTGNKGLRSTDPLRKFESARALSRLDKDTIASYIDEIIIILTGCAGLRNTDQLRAIYAAKALSRFGKETIAPYTDKIITILTGNEGLRNISPWARKRAAATLSRLDKDKIAPYIDEIIAILTNEGINGSYPSIEKEVLVAIAMLDKKIIARYINEITAFLAGKEGLRSTDLLKRAYAEAAFQSIGKENLPVIKVVINYTGLEKSLTILARDTKELVKRLNQDILNSLDISCKALSGKNVEISSLFMPEKAIVNITRESELEQALLYSIASAVFTPIPAKSSSAGLTIEVSKLELGITDEVIAFLTGKEGLKSANPWIKKEAAVVLSGFAKEIIAPYANEITAILTSKDGLRNAAPWIRAEAAAALSGFNKKVIVPYIIGGIITFLTGNDALKNTDPWRRAYAAAALSRLDKGAVAPYIDGVMTFLIGNDGLRNADPSVRAYAAKALSRFDKEIITPYTDEIVTILIGNKRLRSVDPWIRVCAAVVFELIGKEHLPVIKVAINYTGLEKSFAIFAKDAEELAQKLNQDILDSLNISCKALPGGKLTFKTRIRKKLLQRTADIRQEGKLELALASVISNKLFFSSVAPLVKASAAGTISSGAVLRVVDSMA